MVTASIEFAFSRYIKYVKRIEHAEGMGIMTHVRRTLSLIESETKDFSNQIAVIENLFPFSPSLRATLRVCFHFHPHPQDTKTVNKKTIISCLESVLS